MQIQEIADSLIEQIETKLSKAMGNKPLKGYGMCVKNADGVVILAKYDINNSEQKAVTIADNQGTYFYIRYTGSPIARTLNTNEAIGACGGGLVSVPCKLVLVTSGCNDPQALMLLMQTILFKTDLHQPWSYGQKQVTLHEKTFTFLPWDIFESETGKPATEYKATTLQLVAIDFDIRFKMNYNLCKEIKIC